MRADEGQALEEAARNRSTTNPREIYAYESMSLTQILCRALSEKNSVKAIGVGVSILQCHLRLSHSSNAVDNIGNRPTRSWYRSRGV